MRSTREEAPRSRGGAVFEFGRNSEGGPGGGAGGRPLKVNRDLLLAKARRLRQEGERTPRGSGRSRAAFAEAEAAFQRVLEMDPTDGRAYVGLGKLLLSLRRPGEAREVYRKGAANTGGESAYVWQAWGVLEAREGDSRAARRYFDAATVADPGHVGTWHSWGLMEERLGRAEKARDLYLRGLRACSSNGAIPGGDFLSGGMPFLGVGGDEGGPSGQAGPNAGKAPAGTPPTYLLQSLALLASRGGRPLEARAWFEKAVELDDDQPGVWESWGSMEARLGNREAAREYFQNALQGSTSRYAWLSWGRWETRWGELQKGRDLLRIAHRRYPADTPIMQALALSEAKLGKAPEARRLFRRATRQDPLHLPSWQAWGVLEWQRGETERARELFQQGVWASPQSPGVVAIFKAWGDLEQSEGDVETARALYECALQVDGRSRRTWHALAELEEGEGNLTRAEEFRLLAVTDDGGMAPSQSLRLLEQAGSARSSLGPVVLDFVERWRQAFEEAPRPPLGLSGDPFAPATR